MGESNDYYRMGRNTAASTRLVAQHYLLRNVTGWSLHPQVTAKWIVEGQSVPRRIADVACGNGIWTLEQATSDLAGFSGLEFTGFDISTAQFPHPDTWPENVTFETWNIKEPPPERFRGCFDVVNVRLVIAAVEKAEEVHTIMHNLRELLKPGGYLQWLESDVAIRPLTTSHPDDSIVFSFSDELFAAYGIQKEERKWVPELPDTFAKAGWNVVDTVRATCPLWMRKHMWDNIQGALGEIVQGANNPEIEKRFAEFVEEVAKFPHDPPLYVWQVVLSQKPADANGNQAGV